MTQSRAGAVRRLRDEIATNPHPSPGFRKAGDRLITAGMRAKTPLVLRAIVKEAARLGRLGGEWADVAGCLVVRVGGSNNEIKSVIGLVVGAQHAAEFTEHDTIPLSGLAKVYREKTVKRPTLVKTGDVGNEEPVVLLLPRETLWPSCTMQPRVFKP